MKKKLKAIWNIICSDKFAVFSYEFGRGAYSDYMTADYFKWVVSNNDAEFITEIIDTSNNISKSIKNNEKNV